MAATYDTIIFTTAAYHTTSEKKKKKKKLVNRFWQHVCHEKNTGYTQTNRIEAVHDNKTVTAMLHIIKFWPCTREFYASLDEQ